MLRKIKNGLGSLTMCKKCYAFYYQKDWHCYAPESIRNGDIHEISVRLTQCHACAELDVAMNERNDTSMTYGKFSYDSTYELVQQGA